MLKQINIEELSPGMFVAEVTKQQGRLKMKTSGLVRTRAAINKLKDKGILELLIDTEKSVKETPAKAVATKPKAKPKKVSFDDELVNARQLYDEAKALQKELLKSVSKDLPINVKNQHELTERFVSSLERNPNALLCMSQIRDKHNYLLEHSLNVAILMVEFGRHLGMSSETIEELAFAGFVHDIGKSKVDETVLLKPGALNDEETLAVQKHVEYGADILKTKADVSHIVVEAVLQHHERLDGSGYPFKLKGDQISQYGRMLAIVDSYDAMISERSYQKGVTSLKALQILLSEKHQYDEELIQLFIKCIGIHPVGTVVQLSNDKLAMIISRNEKQPLKPQVKVFYSVKGGHYLDPKNIDLATSGNDISIQNAIKPENFKIDFIKFFKQAIAN